MKKILRFLRSEDGPTAVEYAVMLSLIIGLALAGVTAFGQATAASFAASGQDIQNAMSGS